MRKIGWTAGAAALLFLGPLHAQEDALLQKRVNGLARRVELMLGVKFKGEIPATRKTREDYEALLTNSVKEETPRAAESAGTIAYRLLGLLPAKTDPVQSSVTMRRLQTGAYYDPLEKKIFVIEGKIPAAALNALILHELVHAIQDQEHDLVKTRAEARKARSHDRRMALTFLVEGEAAFWTLVYQVKAMGDDFLTISPTGRKMTMSMYKSMTSSGIIRHLTGGVKEGSGFSAAAASLRRSPPLLIRKHYDPYLRGMYAAYRIWEEKGKAGLRETFRTSLPLCTRDMMFSQDMARRPRGIVEVRPAPIGDILGEPWKNTFEDTGGALVLHTMFEHDRRAADIVAKAWDGDRLQVWQDGRVAFIAGVFAFETSRNASTFAKSLERLFKDRWTKGKKPTRDRCKAVHYSVGPDHLLVKTSKNLVAFARGAVPSSGHEIVEALAASETAPVKR